MRRLLRLLIMTLVGMSGIALVLLAIAPFHVYHRLTDERPIAELHFEPIAPQVFKAFLSQGDLCFPEQYLLYGDEWRLDAAFLKWRPVATLLGAEPLYRIDRLSGRYRNVEDENTRPRLAHDVAPEVVIDPFRFAGGGWLVDSVYGSSVYHAIDSDARHVVYRSSTGLFVRVQPLPDLTTEAGQTRIVIDRACGGHERGRLARLALQLNALF